MKTWVKLYTEIGRDPKTLTLSWAQRGIWATLLALAGELDTRDEDGQETGELDTVEYTAIRIRCDLAELQEAVAAFAERGMIEECDGVLVLPNYGKRQEVPPSQTRPAMRDRQRQHRASRVVTLPSHAVTLSDPDPDPETETETEEEKTVVGAVAPPTAVGPLPALSFQDFLDELKAPGANMAVVAVHMATQLYPGHDPPDYGRMGKAAKRLGSWSMLAKALWDESTRPPVGNVLDYIERKHKAGGYRGNGNGRSPGQGSRNLTDKESAALTAAMEEAVNR